MTVATTRTVDLVETAERMLAAAVAVTTGRLHLDSTRQTRALLLHGDERATGYFRHELGRQIGTALMLTDPHVIAVYEEQDAPASEAAIPLVAGLGDPLRLIVLATVQSHATTAFIDAIGAAVKHILGSAVPPQPPAMVRVEVVTDADSPRLRSRARGFRPAPILLASREVRGGR